MLARRKPRFATARTLANFFAGNTENRSGVRVAVKDLDGDDQIDLVVGDVQNAGSRVTGYRGKDLTGGQTTQAFGLDTYPGFNGGVFVG